MAAVKYIFRIICAHQLFSIRYRLVQRAIYFVYLVAGVETALAEIRGQLDKGLFNISETEAMQTKHVHAAIE